MDILDYQGTIEYYEEMMASNLKQFQDKKLTMDEIILRDNLTESCLQAIDHLDKIYKANIATKG